MNDKLDFSKFSKHLFWDVDITSLSAKTNKAFIVKRVLEYGKLSDWLLLTQYLSIDEIATISQSFRTLEPKALTFIALISKQPRNKFLCYYSQQSTAPRWNF